jgi:UDP:flavonoid glycosyltransferase YjiC (YdhE family)
MIPFARAFQRAGHDVAVATSAEMAAVVIGAGLIWYPAGLHPTEAVEMFDGESADYGESVVHEKIVDLVDLIIGPFPADLIVRDPTDLAPVLAAELLGVPCVTFGIGNFIPAKSWRILAKDSLESLRSELHLAARTGFAYLNRTLYVDPLPPSIERSVEVPEERLMHVRYLPWDDAESATTPSWLDDLGGRPAVLVTLGTVYNQDLDLLRSLVGAIADEDLDVVCTTGPNVEPAALGLLPPNVRVERYIPLSVVLPRCDAMLSHGGFNTMMSALCAAVPMVFLPVGSDQFFNANQCVKLGAGIRLAGDDISSRAIRRATLRVLNDPSYGAAAAMLQEEIADLPNYHAAVRRVEKLAIRRQATRVS